MAACEDESGSATQWPPSCGEVCTWDEGCDGDERGPLERQYHEFHDWCWEEEEEEGDGGEEQGEGEPDGSAEERFSRYLPPWLAKVREYHEAEFEEGVRTRMYYRLFNNSFQLVPCFLEHNPMMTRRLLHLTGADVTHMKTLKEKYAHSFKGMTGAERLEFFIELARTFGQPADPFYYLDLGVGRVLRLDDGGADPPDLSRDPVVMFVVKGSRLGFVHAKVCDRNPFLCSWCLDTFESGAQLGRHTALRHGDLLDASNRCSICLQQVRNNRLAIMRHYRKFHRRPYAQYQDRCRDPVVDEAGVRHDLMYSSETARALYDFCNKTSYVVVNVSWDLETALDPTDESSTDLCPFMVALSAEVDTSFMKRSSEGVREKVATILRQILRDVMDKHLTLADCPELFPHTDAVGCRYLVPETVPDQETMKSSIMDTVMKTVRDLVYSVRSELGQLQGTAMEDFLRDDLDGGVVVRAWAWNGSSFDHIFLLRNLALRMGDPFWRGMSVTNHNNRLVKMRKIYRMQSKRHPTCPMVELCFLDAMNFDQKTSLAKMAGNYQLPQSKLKVNYEVMNECFRKPSLLRRGLPNRPLFPQAFLQEVCGDSEEAEGELRRNWSLWNRNDKRVFDELSYYALYCCMDAYICGRIVRKRSDGWNGALLQLMNERLFGQEKVRYFDFHAGAVSAPGSCFNILKMSRGPDNPLYIPKGDCGRIVQQCVLGGRSECQVQGLVRPGEGLCYPRGIPMQLDVFSMYGCCMTYPMPAGKPTHHSRPHRLAETFNGIFMAHERVQLAWFKKPVFAKFHVRPPFDRRENLGAFAPLGVRMRMTTEDEVTGEKAHCENLVWGHVEREQYMSIVDAMLCRNAGYDVWMVRDAPAVSFEDGWHPEMAPYMRFFIAAKSEAKARGDKMEEARCKLACNACYGKTIQKPSAVSFEICTDEKMEQLLALQTLGEVSIRQHMPIFCLESQDLQHMVQYKSREPQYTGPSHFGVITLSYSHDCFMAMGSSTDCLQGAVDLDYRPKTGLYSDTDSVYTTDAVLRYMDLSTFAVTGSKLNSYDPVTGVNRVYFDEKEPFRAQDVSVFMGKKLNCHLKDGKFLGVTAKGHALKDLTGDKFVQAVQDNTASLTERVTFKKKLFPHVGITVEPLKRQFKLTQLIYSLHRDYSEANRCRVFKALEDLHDNVAVLPGTVLRKLVIV